MSENKTKVELLEDQEPSRKLLRIKSDSQGVYNLILSNYHETVFTFSDVKRIILDKLNKSIEESKHCKVSHKGESGVGWGWGQEVTHWKYKTATKLKSTIEKLTMENINEAVVFVDKVEDQLLADSNSAAREGGRPITISLRFWLNDLLKF